MVDRGYDLDEPRMFSEQDFAATAVIESGE